MSRFLFHQSLFEHGVTDEWQAFRCGFVDAGDGEGCHLGSLHSEHLLSRLDSLFDFEEPRCASGQEGLDSRVFQAERDSFGLDWIWCKGWGFRSIEIIIRINNIRWSLSQLSDIPHPPNWPPETVASCSRNVTSQGLSSQ